MDKQDEKLEGLITAFNDWIRSSQPEEGSEDEELEKTLEIQDPTDFLRDISDSYGKKRLFVCCDGTWLSASGTLAPLSNVAKLARSVDRYGKDQFEFGTTGGVPQLIYYSSGVGTRSAIPWADSAVAAATGKGISHVIRDAYCFISNNYNGASTRDEIILVGFSRGAFAVRCLAQFISEVGLLRRRALPFLPVLFEDWVQGDRSLRNKIDGLGNLFFRTPEITILAEWDPVGTLGIPPMWNNKLSHRMKAQIVPKHVKHVFLALSLNEKRIGYHPLIWKGKEDEDTTVSQCAFLGTHGNIGGGTSDPGLSSIPLFWMVSKIQENCKACFDMWALLQFNTPMLTRNSLMGPFGKETLSVRSLANAPGCIGKPSPWWLVPRSLTLGMLGTRDSVFRECAQTEAGIRLKVHHTVALLVKRLGASSGPLQRKPDNTWHLRRDSELTLDEEQLYPDEEVPEKGFEKGLLRRWKDAAEMWENIDRDSHLVEEADQNYNPPYEWRDLIQRPNWNFVKADSFQGSLIKFIWDEIQGHDGIVTAN